MKKKVLMFLMCICPVFFGAYADDGRKIVPESSVQTESGIFEEDVYELKGGGKVVIGPAISSPDNSLQFLVRFIKDDNEKYLMNGSYVKKKYNPVFSDEHDFDECFFIEYYFGTCYLECYSKLDGSKILHGIKGVLDKRNNMLIYCEDNDDMKNSIVLMDFSRGSSYVLDGYLEKGSYMELCCWEYFSIDRVTDSCIFLTYFGSSDSDNKRIRQKITLERK